MTISQFLIEDLSLIKNYDYFLNFKGLIEEELVKKEYTVENAIELSNSLLFYALENLLIDMNDIILRQVFDLIINIKEHILTICNCCIRQNQSFIIKKIIKMLRSYMEIIGNHDKIVIINTYICLLYSSRIINIIEDYLYTHDYLFDLSRDTINILINKCIIHFNYHSINSLILGIDDLYKVVQILNRKTNNWICCRYVNSLMSILIKLYDLIIKNQSITFDYEYIKIYGKIIILFNLVLNLYSKSNQIFPYEYNTNNIYQSFLKNIFNLTLDSIKRKYLNKCDNILQEELNIISTILEEELIDILSIPISVLYSLYFDVLLFILKSNKTSVKIVDYLLFTIYRKFVFIRNDIYKYISENNENEEGLRLISNYGTYLVSSKYQNENIDLVKYIVNIIISDSMLTRIDIEDKNIKEILTIYAIYLEILINEKDFLVVISNIYTLFYYLNENDFEIIKLIISFYEKLLFQEKKLKESVLTLLYSQLKGGINLIMTLSTSKSIFLYDFIYIIIEKVDIKCNDFIIIDYLIKKTKQLSNEDFDVTNKLYNVIYLIYSHDYILKFNENICNHTYNINFIINNIKPYSDLGNDISILNIVDYLIKKNVYEFNTNIIFLCEHLLIIISKIENSSYNQELFESLISLISVITIYGYSATFNNLYYEVLLRLIRLSFVVINWFDSVYLISIVHILIIKNETIPNKYLLSIFYNYYHLINILLSKYSLNIIYSIIDNVNKKYIPHIIFSITSIIVYSYQNKPSTQLDNVYYQILLNESIYNIIIDLLKGNNYIPISILRLYAIGVLSHIDYTKKIENNEFYILILVLNKIRSIEERLLRKDIRYKEIKPNKNKEENEEKCKLKIENQIEQEDDYYYINDLFNGYNNNFFIINQVDEFDYLNTVFKMNDLLFIIEQLGYSTYLFLFKLKRIRIVYNNKEYNIPRLLYKIKKRS